MGDILTFDKNRKKRKSTDNNNVVTEETVQLFNQLFGKFFTGENDENNKEK